MSVTSVGGGGGRAVGQFLPLNFNTPFQFVFHKTEDMADVKVSIKRLTNELDIIIDLSDKNSARSEEINEQIKELKGDTKEKLVEVQKRLKLIDFIEKAVPIVTVSGPICYGITWAGATLAAAPAAPTAVAAATLAAAPAAPTAVAAATTAAAPAVILAKGAVIVAAAAGIEIAGVRINLCSYLWDYLGGP